MFLTYRSFVSCLVFFLLQGVKVYSILADMFLDDSKLIFQQIAHVDAASDAGTVVRVIIENHDAWSHGRGALSELTAAVRRELEPGVAERVASQQARLQSLAVSLS